MDKQINTVLKVWNKRLKYLDKSNDQWLNMLAKY